MTAPVLAIKNAKLAYGENVLWANLNLEVMPHEFIAIIGANGSGKTSLLRAILGQEKLNDGSIELNQKPIHHGSRSIGYIPQHRTVDAATPVRAKDLLRMGLDGHRFGPSFGSKKAAARVKYILGCIDGFKIADKKVGDLSGGELQRLRVGQAVIGEPDLILADEPLSALDLAQQKTIADLLDQERQEHNAAVLFVTHDVNPILSMVDRVLYLANGKFKIGTPDEVLRSDVLSELYGTPVDVLRNQGRIVVVGTQEHDHHDHEEWS
ncbi:metal ABC transporter ATP-binding protein [Rhodoluna sp.]|jgi:zinc/manganese transport system ATP-binding protein|uniref:metal ABC transporter ATP-binding protein n=1 Tax=Rhodoluna sp. TaxID=1969481 RepID=UPI0025CF7C65|nr:metal ABC transporter ATP-binding protein [Rhodoluna sp.]